MNQISPASSEIIYRALINIAVESWRFGKVFERLVLRMEPKEQARYISQFNWFIKKVEASLADAGMHMVNIEGHLFDPGMAATPLNIDEFGDSGDLIVDNMLEPIIMSATGLVKAGTVILRKVT
ncbi:MAG: hypothetical protein ACOX0F_11355 [Syntrophomonadaceae bacterium]|jgi:hypothetical protein